MMERVSPRVRVNKNIIGIIIACHLQAFLLFTMMMIQTNKTLARAKIHSL